MLNSCALKRLYGWIFWWWKNSISHSQNLREKIDFHGLKSNIQTFCQIIRCYWHSSWMSIKKKKAWSFFLFFFLLFVKKKLFFFRSVILHFGKKTFHSVWHLVKNYSNDNIVDCLIVGNIFSLSNCWLVCYWLVELYLGKGKHREHIKPI